MRFAGLELEGDDKPSTDFLANVLAQTNREHEVPALWKALIDKNPQKFMNIAGDGEVELRQVYEQPAQ